jgi:hypothetical protein
MLTKGRQESYRYPEIRASSEVNQGNADQQRSYCTRKNIVLEVPKACCGDLGPGSEISALYIIPYLHTRTQRATSLLLSTQGESPMQLYASGTQ